MNVGEMIDRVRLLIDNDQTDAQIVGQFNELTKKLFRKFVLPEEIYKFQMGDWPYYELPEKYTEERIRCVVIDGVEYLKVSPEIQNPPANFCTVLLQSLYISHNFPGKDAYLYVRPRPDTLSASRLGDIPNFPEDYHDLFVYDAAKWIAGIQRDVDMYNNFQSEFDDIFKDAQRDLKKMGLRRAKETTEW